MDQVDEITVYTALMTPGDLLEPLAEALRQRPAWMAHAACAGLPTEAFFPPPGARGDRQRRDALAVCEGCPVQEPCASYATEEVLEGIYGGTTSEERRERRRRAAA